MEIPGIPGSIMEQIIRYAYLRECELTEDTVFDVYAAADFLLMYCLTEHCSVYILDRLRLDNCVTIMLFGRFDKQCHQWKRSFIGLISVICFGFFCLFAILLKDKGPQKRFTKRQECLF